ncbi:GGDEF domain-containing protein [Pseudoalteromonas sp. KG3]|uniref:diguanylate cyclase n=1 Tax=Pseudoalteromonas prydzensis TaxID=182141 RepID=A0ABR9FK19_9GAMM|nr:MULTISPECIES: GGDEF domain-containing protein [Pseudoalteromonas]MBE0457147.1 GGDEF domain-containing protein [Pseudoalteromonas prydzensis]WKD23042.1 GGDEF domain-containing protein [Pseudoalteromonas sp. KG3]
MIANPCGHEWIVFLTQQTEEQSLDAALITAISGLADMQVFALYINKHFNPQTPPTLLNVDSQIEQFVADELMHLLDNVSKNKVRVSSAFGCITTYVPVYYLGTVIGLLMVESKDELPEGTTVLALHILNVYANQLALIHKSRLDPLTELLNRQTFEKKVIEILSGDDFSTKNIALKESKNWYLAIIDIDHFKRVNDNFGHVIGDEVILLVSRLLKNNFRLEDYVFRYGEEFAVLFQSDDKAAARGVLNRLRTNVAEYPFPQVGNLTVSAGFLELSHIDMVATLVHKADLALYESKNNGRNLVTAYSDLNVVDDIVNDDGIELF